MRRKVDDSFMMNDTFFTLRNEQTLQRLLFYFDCYTYVFTLPFETFQLLIYRKISQLAKHHIPARITVPD
jgi:hypothetical protein